MSPRNSSFMSNISIHAAREGGDMHVRHKPKPLHFISIHAAREGGDGEKGKNCESSRISIHAAREGGDGSAPASSIKKTFDFNPRRP